MEPDMLKQVLRSSTMIPDLDLNFANRQLDSRIQFIRTQSTSTGSTYFGSDGLLKYAAANEPRFTHRNLTRTRTNLFLQSQNHSTSWATQGGTWSYNSSIVRPDGVSYGQLFSEDATTGSHRVFQAWTVVSGTTYTISVFLKYAGRQQVYLENRSLSQNPVAVFNIQNGTVVTQPNSGIARIEAYPNGWYRCSVTATANLTSSNFLIGSYAAGSVTVTGLNGPAFYIFGSQVEIGSSPTTYTPTTTSAVTVQEALSRTNLLYETPLYASGQGNAYIIVSGAGTTAANGSYKRQAGTANGQPWWVNESTGCKIYRAGTISFKPWVITLADDTTLYQTVESELSSPELGTWAINLDGYGANGIAPIPTVQAQYNPVISAEIYSAPDGTNTARLVENTPNVNSRFYGSGENFANRPYGVYTKSVHVKPNSPSYATIIFEGVGDTAGVGGALYFDAITKTFSGGITAGIPITYGYTDLPNGWMRVWVTCTYSATNKFSPFSVYIGGYGNSANQHSVYIWGNQCEPAFSFPIPSGPTDYIPTTTASVTVNQTQSLGLLPEEARTNIIPGSNDFSNASIYSVAGSASLASGYQSPDGTNNAFLLTQPTSINDYFYNAGVSAIALGNTAYTVSIFFKRGTRSDFGIQIDDKGFSGDRYNVIYDYSTGSIGTSGGGAARISSTRVIPYGNGWFRMIMTFTTRSDSSVFVAMVGRAGSTVGSTFIYGLQIEQGAFATTYIPTTAAGGLTRAADIATIAGTNLSSWYKQTSGTIVINYEPPPIPFPTSSRYESVFRFGPSAERWGLINGGSTSAYGVQVFRSNSFIGSGAAITQSTSMQVAFAWDNLGHSQSFNGTVVSTGTVTPSTNANTEFLIGASNLCGTISRIRYYRRRLPNANIQILTT